MLIGLLWMFTLSAIQSSWGIDSTITLFLSWSSWRNEKSPERLRWSTIDHPCMYKLKTTPLLLYGGGISALLGHCGNVQVSGYLYFHLLPPGNENSIRLLGRICHGASGVTGSNGALSPYYCRSSDLLLFFNSIPDTILILSFSSFLIESFRTWSWATILEIGTRSNTI